MVENHVLNNFGNDSDKNFIPYAPLFNVLGKVNFPRTLKRVGNPTL